MGDGRSCPRCGSRIDFRDSFLPGWVNTSSVCRRCGSSLRFRMGVGGHLLKFALSVGLVIGAYSAARTLPDPWSFVAFFLLLILAGLPAALLFVWYLRGCSALVLAPPRRSGNQNAEPS